MAESKMRSKTPDELFADAMSGIRSDFGNNKEARAAELAIAEMHRRLKLCVQAHREVFVMGRDDSVKVV